MGSTKQIVCFAAQRLLALALLLILPERSAAANVTRGPYLQLGTPSSVVLRWRTDVATDSVVRWGQNSTALTNVVTDMTLTTEHVVGISNLQPATKYFYQIGTTAGGFPSDANNYFLTSPLPGTTPSVHIWAIGDAGTGSSEQIACRDSYVTYNGDRPTDVWLMLGDNAYGSGTDSEYQVAVYDMYPSFLRNTVLWPTIGNHDAGNSSGVYLPMFTLPDNGQAGGVPSGTERYYSFDYANIHFVCLDSATSDLSANGVMLNWLRADLAANAQEWIIAYWHHPPYSKGSHDSDAEGGLTQVRQNFLPILEDFGVDLVLCGHSHCYERSYLLDGHYGLSSTLTEAMKKDGGSGREDDTGAYSKLGGHASHEGAVYTVAGSSGHATGGPLDHPAMFRSLDVVGSVVIDVNGSRLDAQFLQSDGTIGDYFTIIKASAPTTPPVAPGNLGAYAVSASQINLIWSDNSTNEQGFRLERSVDNMNFAECGVFGPGVTNAVDAGRLPNTTYYYRVCAYNALGLSPYSAVAYATTFSAPPPGDTNVPAAVTNLVIIGVTSNSATLWWMAPGDDGFVGTAAAYDLRFSTNLITSANFNSATQAIGEPLPALAGTAQSFTVTGLVSGKTYYFALKTYDEKTNASALSVVANATIPLPAAVANLTNVVIIASNSVWKYLDNGTDQSNAWSARTFSDGAWASGPAQLGYNGGGEATVVSYGPNSANKYITTYFRRHFSVTDVSLFDALRFAVQRDDGVVVYVNGSEVFRDNMPATAIDYRTVASTSVSGTNKTAFHLRGPFPAKPYLVDGDNVVAAEVHLRSGGSTAMDFNLEMKMTLAAPSPRILRNSPTQIAIQWPAHPGKRYRVQFATTIPTTNWLTLGNDIVASAPIAAMSDAPTNGMTRFYRVVLVP